VLGIGKKMTPRNMRLNLLTMAKKYSISNGGVRRYFDAVLRDFNDHANEQLTP
jgi:hypothetical protein